MKVKIWPTEKPKTLRDNLEKRVEDAEVFGDMIKAEVEDPEVLERVPGIKEYEADDGKVEGLKGSPVDHQAYAKIQSREDIAEALVATIDGYDLRILTTGMDWDLRMLKRFNPDIKEISSSEPLEVLGIEKALFPEEGLEHIDIELTDEEVEIVYEFMMY